MVCGDLVSLFPAVLGVLIEVALVGFVVLFWGLVELWVVWFLEG